MNSPLLGHGSPVGPPASTDPAPHVSPAPPTSSDYFMDFDPPLDPDYPSGSGPFINPALLPYFNDPLPDQLPFFEELDLDSETG